VLAHPHQLRCGEAGHGQVAGDGLELRPPPGQRFALQGAAAIVPEDAGAEHPALGVEQGRAVHLAREADRRDFRERGRMAGMQLVDRCTGRAEPVLGILFAEAGMGMADGQRLARGREHPVVVVEQRCLHARGAEVDAQGQHASLPAAARALTAGCP
jgi:hypothetical protein